METNPQHTTKQATIGRSKRAIVPLAKDSDIGKLNSKVVSGDAKDVATILHNFI